MTGKRQGAVVRLSGDVTRDGAKACPKVEASRTADLKRRVRQGSGGLQHTPTELCINLPVKPRAE
jgi:hypothetical protein